MLEYLVDAFSLQIGVITVTIRQDFLKELVGFLHHLSEEIDEINLQTAAFKVTLTDSGFVLHFENDLEVGMEEFMGTMRYHGRDSRCTYSGQIVFNTARAKMIYQRIVEMLLALPPNPEDADAESILVG